MVAFLDTVQGKARDQTPINALAANKFTQVQEGRLGSGGMWDGSGPGPLAQVSC